MADVERSDDNDNDDDETSYDYFDRVRASLLLLEDNNSPWRITTTSSNNSNNNSKLLEVEDRRDPRRRFRLMHLSAAYRFAPDFPVLHPYALSNARSALLAQYHFNNRIHTVVPDLELLDKCNLRLTLDFYDNAGNAKTAVEQFLNDIEPRAFPYQTTVLLGPTRSAVAVPLAVLTTAREIPTISAQVTSTTLDDNSNGVYQYFGRTTPSYARTAQAAVEYFRYVLKTTHVGLVHADDEFGTSYQRAFVASARQQGLVVQSIKVRFSNIPGDAAVRASVERALVFLKATNIRTFFATVFTQHWELVHELARQDFDKFGLVGPEYFWMYGGFDLTPNQEFVLPVAYGPAVGLHGSAYIQFGEAAGGFERHLQEFVALNDDPAFGEYFASKSPLGASFQFSSNTTFTAPFGNSENMYDAVMAAGIAGCQTEEYMFSGPQLFEKFLESNFSGASGHVQVDPVTGTRRDDTVDYVITEAILEEGAPEGFNRYVFRLVAKYRNTAPNLDDGLPSQQWFTPAGAIPFNFSDFSNTPPPPLPPRALPSDIVDPTSRVVLWSLAGVVVVTALLLGGWTWRHRQHKVVRVSQPSFLVFICVGEFLIGLAVISAGVTNPPFTQTWANFCCMATLWLFELGVSVVFAALMTKTMRINKIYHGSRGFKRVTVKFRDALFPGFLLVVLNLCLLIAWQVTDPLQYELEFDENGSVDEFNRPVDVTQVCRSKDGLGPYFFGASISVLAITMLATIVQAYNGRNVDSEYSESTQIGLSLAVNFQGLALALPVFFFDTNPQNTFVTRSILLLLIALSTLFLIFAPKVRRLGEHDQRVAREKQEKQRRLEMMRRTSLYGHRIDRGGYHCGEVRSIILSIPVQSLSPDQATNSGHEQTSS